MKKQRWRFTKIISSKCDYCGERTEYYQEEDEGKCCPSCYADLVGISISEVWATIEN